MIADSVLLQQLRWRYAVKKFDPSRKISPEQWRTLEETLVLSPSSYGLQPWKFVVVTDPPTRENLVPFSWNQRQVADASHLVVFCIKTPLKLDDIDSHVQRTAQMRGVTPESLEKFRANMVRDLIEGPRSWSVNQWAANQVFIALGNFMSAAALLEVDTCPMEGFEPGKYDQALGLAKKGLASTVLCAAGYRAADDRNANLPKVRFPHDSLFERI